MLIVVCEGEVVEDGRSISGRLDKISTTESSEGVDILTNTLRAKYKWVTLTEFTGLWPTARVRDSGITEVSGAWSGTDGGDTYTNFYENIQAEVKK